MCLNKEAVLFNFLIIRFVGKEFRYQRGRDGAEEQFRSWARQGDQSVYKLFRRCECFYTVSDFYTNKASTGNNFTLKVAVVGGGSRLQPGSDKLYC